jgi:effector-binding domain-containing protein
MIFGRDCRLFSTPSKEGGGVVTLTEPRIETRREQTYVGILTTVEREQIGAAVPPLLTEVFAWLAERGLRPDGAPFFRYRVIDADATIQLEAAVPVREPVDGDDRVRADVLPSGRYVTAVHTGPPERLPDATAALLAWADDNDVDWDVDRRGGADTWGARLEIYRTDPQQEPNPTRWETELAFRIADEPPDADASGGTPSRVTGR